MNYSGQPKCLIAYDNLDDRRIIFEDLLSRLTPRRRVAFIQDCCGRSGLLGKPVRPGVAAKTLRMVPLAEREDAAGREWNRRLTLDCYMDLWALSLQHGLDYTAALNRLVEMVQRPEACQIH